MQSYLATVIRSVVFVSLLMFSENSARVHADELNEENVSEFAEKLIKDEIVDGLSVGFIQGDRYGTYHFGKASLNSERPSNLTVYELGSVSKLFTSLLVADAAIRGEIELEKPIEVENQAKIVLPSLNGRQISWLDLCVHRSGLPRLPSNLSLDSVVNPYREYTASKATEFFKQYKLETKPGESQSYSNLGVSVLGYLIAEKNHSDYQKLLRERIAEPLKMVDCTIDLSADQKKRFATPHDQVGSQAQAWTFADMPGAGGVRATMRDMMRFAGAQLNPPKGKLGDAIELAWKEHTPADATGAAMGLGWMIAGDGETRWHNGQTGGSHSAVFINRRLKTAIIVLCNTAELNEVDALAAKLIQKSAGIKDEDATVEKSDKEMAGQAGGKNVADATQRARLVGRYQLAPNFIFDVQDKNGRMVVGITNQPVQEVFAESPTKWAYRSVDAKLEFHLREKGPAYALTLHQNGIAQKAKRISK